MVVPQPGIVVHSGRHVGEAGVGWQLLRLLARLWRRHIWRRGGNGPTAGRAAQRVTAAAAAGGRWVCGPALQCHWPAIRQPGTIKHNCKPSDRAHLFSAARGTPALPPGELCSRRSEYAGCPRPVELRAAPHMRAGARLRGEASPPRPQTLSGILESVRKRSERRAPVARLPGLGAAHVPPMLSARRCPLQDPARAPAGECDIQLHLDTARVIL